jgi:hypothetical protein
MEHNDKLARQSSAIVKSSIPSLQPQEIMLLREMRITALNAKVTLNEDLNEEFLRVLSRFSVGAIQAAFRGWRDVSGFFPPISDIRELCLLWERRQAEIREEEERRQRREQVEQARARGEILEWPDVIKKFNDIVSRDAADKLVDKAVMPEVPPNAEIVISDDRREIIRQQIESIKKRYQ